ncbi:M48 family metalloprotease [bacterium]|nr:M48 family metalloprotease [bacterium]
MPFRRVTFVLQLILAISFLSGCATFRSAEKSVNRSLFTAEQETALGTEYSQEIAGEYEFIDDPTVNSWLNEMGAKLVANSPETAQTFQFRVTNSPEVNAFAIPGGFCYVNAGLISYATNEAQVAAVVGHEINHVTARHGLLSLQRAMGINMLMQYLTPDGTGTAAQMAQLAMQSGGFLVTRKFGRDDEREADSLGVKAMYGAGYDPREGAAFFRRLNALSSGASGGMIDTMISTHPPTPERIQNIEEQIAQYDMNSKDLTVNSPLFKKVQGIVRSEVPDLPQ